MDLKSGGGKHARDMDIDEYVARRRRPDLHVETQASAKHARADGAVGMAAKRARVESPDREIFRHGTKRGREWGHEDFNSKYMRLYVESIMK